MTAPPPPPIPYPRKGGSLPSSPVFYIKADAHQLESLVIPTLLCQRGANFTIRFQFTLHPNMSLGSVPPRPTAAMSLPPKSPSPTYGSSNLIDSNPTGKVPERERDKKSFLSYILKPADEVKTTLCSQPLSPDVPTIPQAYVSIFRAGGCAIR